jgi:Nif-specific regulatory protein
MGSLPMDTTLPTELLTLRQIARTVARGDDAESRIQDILRHLAVSHGLLRGRVLIADPPANQIYVRYAHGLTAAEMERGRFRVGEGVSGQVFETGVPALVPDVHEERAYLGRIVPRESLPAGAIAFLVVPVVRHHLPIGVLAALRPPNTTRPVQNDQAVMEVVAMLIAQILCAGGEVLPCNSPVTQGSKVVALPTVPVAIATSARREPPPTATPVVCREELCRHSRDMTLRVARQRHGEGRLHMAAALYLKVAEYHAGSAEAQVAASKLLEIVGYHEGRGNNRLAEDVLKRLDRVLDGGHSGGGDQSPGFGSWEGFGGSGGIGAHPR